MSPKKTKRRKSQRRTSQRKRKRKPNQLPPMTSTASGLKMTMAQKKRKKKSIWIIYLQIGLND